MDNLRKQIFALLPEERTITDLDASPIQKQRIMSITADIMGEQAEKRGATITIPKLWEIRRNLDKLINRYAWTDEAKRYLWGLREILNNPIKNAGADLSKALARYSGVKNVEAEFGDKLKALFIGDETFGTKLEPFLKNILSTDKEETIRSRIDVYSQQTGPVIHYYASRGLVRSIDGMGNIDEIFHRILDVIENRETNAEGRSNPS